MIKLLVFIVFSENLNIIVSERLRKITGVKKNEWLLWMVKK